MSRFYPLKIELDGRRYTGDWCLCQGGRICVRSAFGSLSAEIGRSQPETIAAKTLERIVRADQKQRAADQKRREREIAKVNRYWDRQKLGDDHA